MLLPTNATLATTPWTDGTDARPHEPDGTSDEAPRAIDRPPGEPADAQREPAHEEDRREGDGADRAHRRGHDVPANG